MKKSFDPEKSLLSLPVVHWIAGTSVALAVIFSLPILVACYSMPLSISGNGFNYFALQFKVPLGILALGLALIGLCGANHRSEQTKRQIERTAHQIDLTTLQIKLTTGQNNFSNYFKHLEEFEKHHLAQESEMISAKPIRSLHNEIFPGVREGVFSSSPRIQELFELKIKTLIIQWISISRRDNGENYLSEIHKMIFTKDSLSKQFGIKTKRTTGSMYPINGTNIIIPQNDLKSLYASVFEVIVAIDTLLQFDPQYISPPSVELMKNVNTSTFSAEAVRMGELFRIPPFEIFIAGHIQQ